MKNYLKKTFIAACISSLLFVSCSQEDSVASTENNSREINETQQYKFSQKITIKDQTGQYSVDLKVSSDNTDLIQNYLDSKPSMKVDLNRDTDNNSASLQSNSTTEKSTSSLMQEKKPDLEVEILNKKIPANYTMSLSIKNISETRKPNTQQNNTTLATARSAFNIAYKDDSSTSITLQNLESETSPTSVHLNFYDRRYNSTLNNYSYAPVGQTATTPKDPNYFWFTLPFLSSKSFTRTNLSQPTGLKVNIVGDQYARYALNLIFSNNVIREISN
ncbi:hypothetical protein [Flavobacterium sp.]|uniref:hypothetical protein n=1 Tax=Flavobacterium sp. TaxID=239 RepID=UPI003753BD36